MVAKEHEYDKSWTLTNFDLMYYKRALCDMRNNPICWVFSWTVTYFNHAIFFCWDTHVLLLYLDLTTSGTLWF